MTTSAQLGVARQSVQLRINQTKPKVQNLENLASGGASWNQIDSSWNTVNSELNSQLSELDNLQKQNAGLNGDPGQTRVTTLITKNKVEVTTMQTTMNGIQTQSFKNTQKTAVRENITKDSSGTIVNNEKIYTRETARFTTPSIDDALVIKASSEELDATLNSLEVVPFLESSVKPTNARKANLRNLEELDIGDNKGSGSTSTTGGDKTVTSVGQTQTSAISQSTGSAVTPLSGNNKAGGGASNVQVAPGDDALSASRNNVGSTINADGVEGRTSVAAEFLEKIVPTPNPLLGLASQTYSISIYLMNTSEYRMFLGTDKKILPTKQLILQSGGAKPEQRNKYFDLDFYIENLEIQTNMSSQSVGSPHNVLDISFDIMEPQGFSFIERLKQAITDHVQDKNVNASAQTYLMVIRFYGYDEFGNLVTKRDLPAGDVEETSDSDSLVEKFIPFSFNDITYKVNNKAVVYQCKCNVIIGDIGYSTARGTIPFNFQLNASSVKKLLNGNSELMPLVPLVTQTGKKVDPRFRSATGPIGSDGLAAEEQTVSVEQQRAGKIGLQDRTVTSGLCDALNQHQREIAKKNGSIPDEYIIEIEDVPGLIDAKMKKAGKTNNNNAPMYTGSDANQQKNMKKQSLDTQTKEYSISAGTQIVQLIDQVMKNSTYVTAQQTIAFDEITGREIVNAPVQTVMWYKISQIAAPKEYDKVRQTYAYQITYRISRYQINTPRSPYFPPAMYRGTHKLYNYWFTGLNTEIIDFEIDVKANYLEIIGKDGKTAAQDEQVGGDARFVEQRFFQSAPDSSTQGSSGDAGRPAAQLAARLYSPTDVAGINMTIVGDPDMFIQSELFYQTHNLKAFEPDGSVNANAGEVLFETRFNRVSDYNMATGETPVNSNNSDSKITGEKNLAQESTVYCLLTVNNKFVQGKFTQELFGVIRTFDNAVNSPKQKQIEKNEVERVTQVDDFNEIGKSARSSKNVIPPGARSSRQFQPNAGSDPRANNFKTATLNGSKTNTQKKEPYSSALVNNATTGRIAKLPDSTVNYTDDADVTPGEAEWTPPGGFPKTPNVQPKPGSNTVSDDAGTKTSPMQESLFAKRRREARARSEAAQARGAKVVGGQGGGTNSSAFR